MGASEAGPPWTMVMVGCWMMVGSLGFTNL